MSFSNADAVVDELRAQRDALENEVEQWQSQAAARVAELMAERDALRSKLDEVSREAGAAVVTIATLRARLEEADRLLERAEVFHVDKESVWQKSYAAYLVRGRR